jgi:outer membrane protein OmpU
MNNIKKLGLTALAGSLVTMGSATAGEMSVSGAINVTLGYGNLSGNSSRAIGSDRDVSFTGGGELDNGTTFSMNTTMDDNFAVSSSTTTITTPSFGSFTLGTGYGLQSGKYDEEVPQAYEQISDGKQTMANLVGNYMDGNAISYTSPTLDMMGAQITLDAGFAPTAADSAENDGSNDAFNASYGKGQELGLTISYDALKVGVYGSERETSVPNTNTTSGQEIGDEFNGAWYVKYSMGPVSIGYSETYMDAGVTADDSSSVNSSIVERTGGGIFTGEQLSIAFNVNDNMSISYTTSDETYDTQDNAATAVTTDDDVTESVDAIQVAYSMGGMSIKAYNMEVTNPDQDDNAADASITESALGFAF